MRWNASYCHHISDFLFLFPFSEGELWDSAQECLCSRESFLSHPRLFSPFPVHKATCRNPYYIWSNILNICLISILPTRLQISWVPENLKYFCASGGLTHSRQSIHIYWMNGHPSQHNSGGMQLREPTTITEQPGIE